MHAPTSMPSPFTSFIRPNAQQSIPSRTTLVKLDASSGWMMIPVSFLEAGTVLFASGTFTRSREILRMARRRSRTPNTNSL